MIIIFENKMSSEIFLKFKNKTNIHINIYA